ncbi:Rieske 2Fe-2S domain-containing protein [Streptomyces albulus]|uniref:Rieske 2Fe-2S domain-containing protein n=1 Tax=Streptomyces noursei TaxID=1971 RepID=UPI001F2E2D63|nr:Rieske 2Fe-2S domain-containing protein [Streptomyces noursei]MCE4946549.1 Rieske 2Fe-2S domain-containing protein [Streptomyces noursei]
MTPQQDHMSTGLPPNPNGLNLAASWYIALSSRELTSRPRAVELFDEPLVAWRDGAGRPVVMPRFCPHMGASLALGRVVDGALRCPFHHWRFDASGTCVAIPGVDRIPRTARRTPYPTVERYGYVWVWYGGPDPQFALPDFPAMEEDRGDYVGFRFSDRTTGTARQLLENAIDYFHFMALHGMSLDPVAFRQLHDQAHARDNGPAIADDAWFGVRVDGTLRTWSLLENPVRWVHQMVTTFGSGPHFRLLIDGWPGGQRFTTYIEGEEISKVLMGITPTGEYRTVQRGWAGVRKANKHGKTLLHSLLFYAQNRGGTAQDIPIYNTTATGRDSTYVRYDNVLVKYRRYYQSWVDRAALAPTAPGEAP